MNTCCWLIVLPSKIPCNDCNHHKVNDVSPYIFDTIACIDCSKQRNILLLLVSWSFTVTVTHLSLFATKEEKKGHQKWTDPKVNCASFGSTQNVLNPLILYTLGHLPRQIKAQLAWWRQGKDISAAHVKVSSNQYTLCTCNI